MHPTSTGFKMCVKVSKFQFINFHAGEDGGVCKAIIVSTPTDIKTEYVWLRFFVVAWARIYN